MLETKHYVRFIIPGTGVDRIKLNGVAVGRKWLFRPVQAMQHTALVIPGVGISRVSAQKYHAMLTAEAATPHRRERLHKWYNSRKI